MALTDYSDLLPAEADLLYEEELLRNPFALKLWWRYLEARKGAVEKRRWIIYERALKALPGSYKLWHAYLQERQTTVKELRIDHPAYEAVNNTFERALVTMHKMPRIWLEYLTLLTRQKLVTRTRKAFDRALCSLPVTQHDRIWEIYLKFVSQEDIPVDTSLRVFRRYIKFDPSHVEEYIEFLVRKERWEEAAIHLAKVLDDEDFVSIKGKTKHQLWLELCDLCCKHAKDVEKLKVDNIIRGGIRKFTDEVGRLWTSLADFYIRRALFEQARNVYEEGLATVKTVRDFSMIFDAYTQFEESLLSAKMEAMGDEDEEEDEDLSEWKLPDVSNDIDLRLARLEHLTERRPELLSSVMLRQNPHNVHEWHKRVKLFKGDPSKQILTYTEAVKTVDPGKAVGKLHTLWIAFAKFYEEHKDLKNARVIFSKAVEVNFKNVDDLASVWCEFCEMELRHKNYQEALKLCRTATQEKILRQRLAKGEVPPPQLLVHKNVKLWSFYVDLEESLGTIESTKNAYNKMFDLKIVTPQIVINYASFMEENKFFEEAFKVYEKGVAIFKYPHVKEIWSTYLKKFVTRFQGSKLERARDLFEQAIAAAPPEQAKPIYLMYAKYEEDYGLARHAMAVYDKATKAVQDSDKLQVYELYIQRASEFFGVTKTREIYEEAIEAGLPYKDVKTMCMKYASLERKLGEIDRARAIYIHASQMANPATEYDFWKVWNNFEVQHGNEDTFREMLRIKRSVSAAHAQQHFMSSEAIIDATTDQAIAEAGKRKREDDDQMAALEAQVTEQPVIAGGKAPQFVSSGVVQQGDSTVQDQTQDNAEEIDIDEEEEGGDDMAKDVATMAVPDTVFGKALGAKDQGETLGASERLKRARNS